MSKGTGFQATASGVVPLAHVQHLENIIHPFLGPTFSLILCLMVLKLNDQLQKNSVFFTYSTSKPVGIRT